MKVIVKEDYSALCGVAADLLEQAVRAEPSCRLGLATGSSPIGVYQELSRRCREEGLDFSRVHTVNLDEYVGLEPGHEQSYRSFMDRQLFSQINIPRENTYVPLGVGDMEKNLRSFRRLLSGGETSVQLLGLGADGHIGFKETRSRARRTWRSWMSGPSRPTPASLPTPPWSPARPSPWAWGISCRPGPWCCLSAAAARRRPPPACFSAGRSRPAGR